jgi:hypothetical protein
VAAVTDHNSVCQLIIYASRVSATKIEFISKLGIMR